MNRILKYSIIGIISLIAFIVLYSLISPVVIHWDCYTAGGKWTMCGSGCGDSCESLKIDTLCPMMMMPCCDCGPDKCWDGNKCILNSKALNSE